MQPPPPAPATTTPPGRISGPARLSTPESLPSSTLSTPSTVFDVPEMHITRSDGLGVPISPESADVDPTDATPTPSFVPSFMDRSSSTASIPILFEAEGSDAPALGLAIELGGPEPASGLLRMPSLDRTLSDSSSASSTSAASRRLSAISALTGRASRSSYATQPTAPPTPIDRAFKSRHDGSHSQSPASRLAAPFTLSTKPRSRSTAHSPVAVDHDVASRPRAATVTSAPASALPPVDDTMEFASLYASLPPAPTAAPLRRRSKTVMPEVFLPAKLTDRQRELFGEAYDIGSTGTGLAVQRAPSSQALPSPTRPTPPPAKPDRSTPETVISSSPQRLKTPPSFADGRTIAERRGSPPQPPLKIASPPRGSSLGAHARLRALTGPSPLNKTSASLRPRSDRLDSTASSPSVASSHATSTGSGKTFNESNTSSSELPVGELFRTLQLWFDQEGFREIAPNFTFDCYSPSDDLLYFSTGRVGYPFHYDSMQQLPRLRRVVAPDYEDAYALLEGKSDRFAGGRRDFIGRQASLDIRGEGKFMVEGREGKYDQWIWRFTYEVEERKSLVGKQLAGERSLIPLTFACSPEILDPSHARKPTLFNTIKKSMHSKCSAVPVGPDGLPVPRPRRKSLGHRAARGRSDSTARLLHSPQARSNGPSPSSFGSSVASSPASTPLRADRTDEESQARLFRTIAPASASRLRPGTAGSDHRGGESSRPGLRRHKTTEQLRRPMTADPTSVPPVPSLSLFGMAPQPTRATPTRQRPGTAEDRPSLTPSSANKRNPHRTVMAFSPVPPVFPSSS